MSHPSNDPPTADAQVRRERTSTRLRWCVFGVCCFVLIVALLGYGLSGSILVLWGALRLCVLLIALTLIATAGRWSAVLVVCAWAVIASPLVIGQTNRGFLINAPFKIPGEEIGHGAPSGPYAVKAGPIPVGLTMLTTPEYQYIGGESSDPDSALVAWSFTALPWPHIEPNRIIDLHGNEIENWVNRSTYLPLDMTAEEYRKLPDVPLLVVHRDHSDLLVSGYRVAPHSLFKGSPPESQLPPQIRVLGGQRPEIRALVWQPTHSPLTILGWLLIALAVRARLRARGPFLRDEPRQSAATMAAD